MSFLQNDGLSHSEIFGSKVICTYPKLIAAYHVLHRLREPRHPPCALAYFLSNVLFSYWYWLGELLPAVNIAYSNTYGLIYTFSSYFLFYFLYIMSKIVFSFQREWRITDSNRWPSACKADALASWANPPRGYSRMLFLVFSCQLSLFLVLELGSPRQSWTADLYIISVAL